MMILDKSSYFPIFIFLLYFSLFRRSISFVCVTVQSWMYVRIKHEVWSAVHELIISPPTKTSIFSLEVKTKKENSIAIDYPDAIKAKSLTQKYEELFLGLRGRAREKMETQKLTLEEKEEVVVEKKRLFPSQKVVSS